MSKGFRSVILCLLLFCIIIISAFAGFKMHIVILLVFFVIFVTMIKSLITLRESRRILSFLNDACDPPRYIYELTHQGKFPTIKGALLSNNLAVGYLDNGEVDIAMEVLYRSLNEDKPQGPMLAVLNYNLASVYLRKGCYMEACPYIEQFKANFFVPQKGTIMLLGNKPLQKGYSNLLANIEVETALINSEYTKALEIYQGLLQNCNNNGERVKNHYYLAFIYGKLGDCERQREHLKYVALHGNRMFIARLARALLEKYADTEGCIDFYSVTI